MLLSHPTGAHRTRTLCSALALLLLFIISCSDQIGTGLGTPTAARGLRFAPRFVAFGSNVSSAPVVNVRLTARNASSGAQIAQAVVSVDPNAAEWDLDLDVPSSAGSVIVLIELLNADNGIEWSGETAPIRVEAGQSSAPPTPVQLFQGPPGNLQVTGVVVTPGQQTVQEGASVQLAAAVQPASVGATVFWTSLDPSVATVTQAGQVTTLRDGQARIVAHAGAHADTSIVIATARPAAITVIPDTTRIGSFGLEFTMTARVTDGRGAEISGAAVEWSSVTPSIVFHLGANRFRSVSNGIATVTARLGTLQASGVVVVAQRATRVNVTPADASLNALGATQTYTATQVDASGNPVGGAVTWRVVNPAVATIDQNGVARAIANGTTEIVATANAGTANQVAGSASLTVVQTVAAIELQPNPLSLTAAGDTARVTAVARDANGNPMPGAVFTWQSSNPAVATVVNGLVRATGFGSATIIAQSEGVQGRTNVSVAQTVASLAVVPATHTFTALAQTLQLTVEARDRNGNPVAARATWQSSNPQAVTVDTLGFVRAVGAGNATITATVGSLSATSQINVAPTVANVTVNPPLVTFTALNDTARITASAFDDSGAPVAATFVWQSSDTTVATVVDGLVRSIRVGNATITASVGNAMAAATAQVTQTATSVQLTPDSVTFTSLDQSITLTAQVRDRNGVLITNRRPFYTSSNPAAATVDTLGVVRAVGDGYARITGTVDNAFDTVGVAVRLVQTEGPNLIVSDASIDSGILDDGSTPVVNIQLANIGTTAGEVGTVRLRVLNAGGGGELVIAQAAHEAIAAGATSSLAIPFTIDTTRVWPDSIYLTVAVDQFNTTAELNESDNLLQTDAYFLRFPVRSVTLAPATALMTVIGDSVQLTKTAFDRRGVVRADSITLRVIRDSLQTGEASGLRIRNGWAVGMAPAAALVEARSISTGFADTAYVQVRPVPDFFNLVVRNEQLFVGDTTVITGEVYDRFEDLLPYPIVWSSLDTAVVRVDAAGVIRAISAGSGRIVASVFGHWGVFSDTATVTVSAQTLPNLRAVRVLPYQGGAPTENGATYQAMIRNAGNATAAGNTVRLSFLHPATGAQLHSREFGMNPLGAGDSINFVVALNYEATAEWPDSVLAELRADALGVVAESDEQDNVVTGGQARVTWFAMSINVQPADTTLNAIGDSVRIRVTSLDRFQRPVADSLFLNIVNAQGEPAVALRNQYAVALRSSAGVQIEGRSRSNTLFADTVTLRIAQLAASLQISAATDTIYGIENDLQLTVTALDRNNNEFIPTPTWTSLDPNIVNVTQMGIVGSLQLGTGRIVASMQGLNRLVADTFAVVVANAGIDSLVVFPAAVLGGDTTRIFAFAYSNGTPTPVTPIWTSRNPDIVTVDETGLLTGALVTDSTYVIATYGEFTDSATVHVITQGGMWLGRSTNWHSRDNWSNNEIPDSDSDYLVWIRATAPNMPVITNAAAVNNLFIEAGATLELSDANLSIHGSVLAQGAITGDGTVIKPSPGTITGTFPRLTINHDGMTTTSGDVTVNGDMNLAAGTFWLVDGTTMTVTGDFTQQEGTLRMTTPASEPGTLVVQGNFTVMGGGGENQLIGGRLQLHGNLEVYEGATQGFMPSGDHSTIFAGAGVHAVTFGASDSTTQRLNTVSVQNQALVRFVNETHVVGDFIVAGVIEVLAPLELWDQATFSQTAIVRYGMIQQPETGTITAFSYLWTDPFFAAGQPGRRLFFRDQTQ